MPSMPFSTIPRKNALKFICKGEYREKDKENKLRNKFCWNTFSKNNYLMKK